MREAPGVRGEAREPRRKALHQKQSSTKNTKCLRCWCAVCVRLRRVRYGLGGVLRRPRTPHAFLYGRRGRCALGTSPTHTPPFDPPAPLRAAARRGSPGRLPPRAPPCRGAQGKMSVCRRYFTFRAPALAGAMPRTRSRRQCSPSGRSTPESFGRFCAALNTAAQSRSHAGCALGGYRLASSSNKGDGSFLLPRTSVGMLTGITASAGTRTRFVTTTHIRRPHTVGASG